MHNAQISWIKTDIFLFEEMFLWVVNYGELYRAPGFSRRDPREIESYITALCRAR